MDSLLNLLSGPWTTYIIWVILQKGPIRFGDIRREIPGISARVLTERLRRLEAAKILLRDQKQTIPPQVYYSLTDRGRQLKGILDDLSKISEEWELV